MEYGYESEEKTNARSEKRKQVDKVEKKGRLKQVKYNVKRKVN